MPSEDGLAGDLVPHEMKDVNLVIFCFVFELDELILENFQTF